MVWERHWAGRPKTFLRNEQQINHPIRELIAREVHGSVLDVGCGSCIDYPRFKRKKINYTGIDITEKFLRYARQLYPEVQIRCGTVLSLPFKDKSYNTVYCKDLIEHLHPKTYRKAIAEMWRVAKNKIILGFYLPPWDKPTSIEKKLPRSFFYNRYNKKEIISFLETLNDFKSLEVTENIGFNNSALYVVEKGA